MKTYPKNRVYGRIHVCRGCGSEFRGKGTFRIFCSRECNVDWQRRTAVSGSRALGWKGGRKVGKCCESCGKHFQIYLSTSKQKPGSGRFCSAVCRIAWMSTLRGENACNWKGGVADLRDRRLAYNAGSHTADQWEDLKWESDYRCLCCGKKEPEIKLTKDHIRPVVLGGSDDISNIQPLCKKCNLQKHKRWINYSTGVEITDFKAFLVAVSKGELPLDLLVPNMVFLNAMAERMKESFDYPGCELVKGVKSSIRG